MTNELEWLQMELPVETRRIRVKTGFIREEQHAKLNLPCLFSFLLEVCAPRGIAMRETQLPALIFAGYGFGPAPPSSEDSPLKAQSKPHGERRLYVINPQLKRVSFSP